MESHPAVVKVEDEKHEAELLFIRQMGLTRTEAEEGLCRYEHDIQKAVLWILQRRTKAFRNEFNETKYELERCDPGARTETTHCCGQCRADADPGWPHNSSGMARHRWAQCAHGICIAHTHRLCRRTRCLCCFGRGVVHARGANVIGACYCAARRQHEPRLQRSIAGRQRQRVRCLREEWSLGWWRWRWR